MKHQLAFPCQYEEHLPMWNGMTLRDYFAAKAMVGLMGTERANQYIDEGGLEMDYEEEGSVGTLFVHTDQMAEEAYMIADMMLKARGE